ncbi:MAG: PH domain-containing protein [Patescibacteria group bacterium]
MNYSNPIILEEGEQVVHNARKHWFLILVELFSLGLGLFLPIIFFIIFKNFALPFSDALANITTGHLIFFGALWFLLLWIMAFSVITDYTLDVVKITNRRIIDIDQRGFFSRNIATVHLNMVQDVTIEATGILPTLLHYGNLTIQSAGEQKEFVIKGLRNPDLVKEIIINEQGNALLK